MPVEQVGGGKLREQELGLTTLLQGYRIPFNSFLLFPLILESSRLNGATL